MQAEAVDTTGPLLRTALYDELQVELAREIRQLAWDMIRMEHWAREAANRSQFDRVHELHWHRELCIERRSRLMRELWASRNQ
jgi:hypothetical protein